MIKAFERFKVVRFPLALSLICQIYMDYIQVMDIKSGEIITHTAAHTYALVVGE